MRILLHMYTSVGSPSDKLSTQSHQNNLQLHIQMCCFYRHIFSIQKVQDSSVYIANIRVTVNDIIIWHNCTKSAATVILAKSSLNPTYKVILIYFSMLYFGGGGGAEWSKAKQRSAKYKPLRTAVLMKELHKHNFMLCIEIYQNYKVVNENVWM